MLATAGGQVVSGTGLAARELPGYAVTGRPASGLKTISGTVVAWAVAPVELVDPGTANIKVIGLVYDMLTAPSPPRQLLRAPRRTSRSSPRLLVGFSRLAR